MCNPGSATQNGHQRRGIELAAEFPTGDARVGIKLQSRRLAYDTPVEEILHALVGGLGRRYQALLDRPLDCRAVGEDSNWVEHGREVIAEVVVNGEEGTRHPYPLNGVPHGVFQDDDQNIARADAEEGGENKING